MGENPYFKIIFYTMAALRNYNDITRDLEIGTTVPSCPSNIAPFILQNHQLAISKYLREHDSLLLWHGLGSGKTITSIASAFESSNTQKNTVIVACPASLMDNYQEELEKYKDLVIQFTTMPHSGLAIDIANKFIQEFKIQAAANGWPEPPWFKAFIEKLINKIGTTGDITQFSDIPAIIASNTEPVLVGGKKTKRKRNKKNKTRGGYKPRINVEVQPTRDIQFVFKSTNGILNTRGFGDLRDTYLIIIDESQLFLSQLRLDYSEIDLSKEMPASFAKHLIPMDEFQGHIGKKYGHVGFKNPRAHLLYSELLNRPPHTKLALLSATPIIKNKFEIAIFVNLLSRDTKMPVNASAFEHNYGILDSIPQYDYRMTSEIRRANIAGKIACRIRNELEFKKNCGGLVSFFGNVAEMLPPLRILKTTKEIHKNYTLRAIKHVFNNDGNPFLNIIECPLTEQEAIQIKYLQFVSELHGNFGKFKPDFYDCAFPLDSPDDRGAPVPPRHLKSDDLTTGLAETTGRADALGILIRDYLHTFQNFLDDSPTALTFSAIGSTSKVPLQAAHVVGKQDPISLSSLRQNSKISKLLENILAHPESRHVIYVTSRYASVVIGRLLEKTNYLELKTPAQLGIGIGFQPAVAAVPDNLFAFLRGESEDNVYDPSQKMLRYTNDEGNAVNKADLIKLFNSDTHYDQFKILIINNCVAEGITLKRVDFMHVVSIPYDIAKLQQIVARVYRNCVHPPGGSITPYIYITTESNDGGMEISDSPCEHSKV